VRRLFYKGKMSGTLLGGNQKIRHELLSSCVLWSQACCLPLQNSVETKQSPRF
jgi:hypothetical protein